ncbi:hypothetical protein FHX44_11240 [Pseudonocardia hierapolitana]|uniref:Uncharacterized protein n=1 Tax=Pseudonocardia hierapolitana TaxID=1128676 RepID=A0A561SHL4_9PSEU|nr:hypothetical protein [Pseudonocardia hierapolitana]TWF74360.1 hypothetical protein FHX44_11240 [Pseudonocardia hierapolitana]
MGSMEELEGRVTALEVQMRSVRQDAAAARVLAGGADRDVAALATKLDAHTRLLEALRETQVEDHERIAGLEGRFDGLEGRFDGLEGRFDGLEGRFDGLEGRFDGLEHGQAMILDLLRRRNGEEPPAAAE